MNNEEKEVLLDHDYDGIQEFDFSLPNWWLVTFWGGLIFGVGYIAYYFYMNGPSLKHEYFVEEEKIREIRFSYLKELRKFDIAKFNEFRNDENMLLYGQAVFENNCMACHNQNGAGDIGPNLTDHYWLYTEGETKNLYKFIFTGNPDGGMPAWGEILSKDDFYAVSAYIDSLKGFEHSDPPAKDPQGDEYK